MLDLNIIESKILNLNKSVLGDKIMRLIHQNPSLVTSFLIATGIGLSAISSVEALQFDSLRINTGVGFRNDTISETRLNSQLNPQLSPQLHSQLIAQNARGRRIEFANNASSATVESSVVRGDRLVYMVGASRGQTMSINIDSTQAQGGALFTVISPDGTVLDMGVSSFSRELTRSGDYQISVSGSRGNASFSLTVGIR